MVKKIFLIILLSVILVSCGKKGCPKFDQKEKCSELFKKI